MVVVTCMYYEQFSMYMLNEIACNVVMSKVGQWNI